MAVQPRGPDGLPHLQIVPKSFRGEPIAVPLADRSADLDQSQHELLGAALRAYRGYSAWDLSAITHQPGTPWHEVYNGGRGEGAIIPDAVIGRHYAERLREEDGG